MNTQINKIWNKCLSFIKDNISEAEYNTWFSPIVPINIHAEKTLTIQVPTAFFIEWIEEHYLSLLRTALTNVFGDSPKLNYIVKIAEGKETPQITQQSSLKQPIKKVVTPYNPYALPGIVEVEIDPRLNRNKNFDSFIEGISNRVAYNISLTIANKPGETSFNPLFVSGGVGLGKTHLLHAIGLKVQENFPEKKVLYIETENFTKQFIDATKRGQTNDFIHFYQQVDVLLVDNIQFLSGKTKTQDAFFHIFTELHNTGKQIVLTSDKPLSSIRDVEERLLSRFGWGISTELGKPDSTLRRKILHQILEKSDLQINQEVIDFIVNEVDTNIRELEGVCNSLIAEAITIKNDITLDLAKGIIQRNIGYKKKNVTFEDIKEIISTHFNISEKDLLSNKKTRHIAQARQITMFFAKKYTNDTLQEIGKKMNRKHTTVIHGCNTIEDLKETDNDFKQVLSEIEVKIKQ